MPLAPVGRPRRDSWPPTQVRLTPADEHDDSLDGIDEDPLTYFLTPTPAFDNADGGADLMDFDAGIEDVNHPREIVRSVSPSSLDGLKRPSRKGSPDSETPEVATPVEDDDDEDYIRFQPRGLGLPLHLRDYMIDGIKSKSRLSMSLPTLAADALLSPNTFHGPTSRGRTPARGHGHARTRSLSARRRPQHLWREPSPDVWSIEEETEEELNSEMGSSAAKSDAEDESNTKKSEDHLEFPAAKPKKKVRFVLPVKE